MLRSVEPQLVAQWTLLGLSKTHRALLRRTVERLLRNEVGALSASPEHVGAQEFGSGHAPTGVAIEWCVLSEITDLQELILGQSTGVIVVERSIVETWLGESIGSTTEADNTHATLENAGGKKRAQVPVGVPGGSGPILLIWNWHPRGAKDLLWGTMIEFDGLRFAGVIHDVSTLHAWCRSACRNGSFRSMQSNRMLQAAAFPPQFFENQSQGELR